MDKCEIESALNTLESAIARGVLTVKFENKEVIYRSLSDMFRVRDFLLKKLGYSTGKKVIGVYDKGLSK